MSVELARTMLAEFLRVREERQVTGSTATKVGIVVQRNRPPAGRTLRTPFGPGEIACVHEDGRVVAYVDLERAIRTIQRAMEDAGDAR